MVILTSVVNLNVQCASALTLGGTSRLLAWSVSHTKAIRQRYTTATLYKAIVIRSVQHLTTRMLSELDSDAFC